MEIFTTATSCLRVPIRRCARDSSQRRSRHYKDGRLQPEYDPESGRTNSPNRGSRSYDDVNTELVRGDIEWVTENTALSEEGPSLTPPRKGKSLEPTNSLLARIRRS